MFGHSIRCTHVGPGRLGQGAETAGRCGCRWITDLCFLGVASPISKQHSILNVIHLPFFHSFILSLLALGMENQADNQAVESEDFAKDQNQDHADKYPGLLHVTPHAHVSHNTNGIAGSRPREAHTQTTG